MKRTDHGAMLGWSAKQGKPLEFDSYPSRHIFGHYVTDFLIETEKLASSHNIEIKFLPNTEVTDIKYSSRDSTFDIKWSQHQVQESPDANSVDQNQRRAEFNSNSNSNSNSTQLNCIFLCTGKLSISLLNDIYIYFNILCIYFIFLYIHSKTNVGPASLVNHIYPEIKNTPQYIANPWPYTNYANIPTTATVAVVGTGNGFVVSYEDIYIFCDILYFYDSQSVWLCI